jgi:hypothetical protein
MQVEVQLQRKLPAEVEVVGAEAEEVLLKPTTQRQ